MKNEQLPKDIEFNNLCDDYNNAKEECDKLKDENYKIKQDLAGVLSEEQKKDEEYNQLIDDLNLLQVIMIIKKKKLINLKKV